MSGLSLASHPRLAGAGRHRFGANPIVCALALCALVLRARPCGGFALLCFMPVAHSATGSRAHTVLPTRCGVGALVFARGWQRGLLWACLLGGWLGFGVCAGGVFAWGVCVLACVRSRGGWWDSVVPPPPCPACLRAHALAWALFGVCAACVCPMGGGRPGRGGTTLSRPLLRGAGLLRSPRGAEREKVGWGALMVR